MILLMEDSCLTHSNVKHLHIQLVLLPPNFMSKLQHMDETKQKFLDQQLEGHAYEHLKNACKKTSFAV